MPRAAKEQPALMEFSLPGNLFLKGAVLSEVGLQLPEEISFEQMAERRS
jgi:hypothetical protein